MTAKIRDAAFDQFVQRYHKWKGMQPKGEQQTERDILRWAYDIARFDYREKLIERLFGEELR